VNVLNHAGVEEAVPEAHVIQTIQTKLRQMTPQHQSVAHVFLETFDRAVFMSAREVSELARTSEATVVRFAKSLGFSGFPEFQGALQVILRQKMVPKERLQRAGGVPKTLEGVIDRIMESALANLQETRAMINLRDLQSVAAALIGAKVRYVIGLRGSSGTAEWLGHCLGLALSDVRTITQGGPFLFEQLISATKRDVVVALSYPRYTKWTVEGLSFARARGARTIAITDSRLSPAAQVADITLVAVANSATFANSYVAPMLITDAVIGAILSLDTDATLARLDALERAYQGLDFFYAGVSAVSQAAASGKVNRKGNGKSDGNNISDDALAGTKNVG
jgi:DNA-binding MurR/RpiR family transcriptional regulator